MDYSFRLSSILARNAVKKYKNKPDLSVAHGVRKRLQHSIQNQKSSRLTLLNTNRNLETCSPVPQTPLHPQRAQGEGDRLAHRLQQLERWKLEKQQKKRDEASVRRKPFVVGVVPVPLKYEPPPPLRAPRPQPSTSGRVTRSQATRANPSNRPSKLYNNKQSFAPTNAGFKPKLNNLPQMPLLLPLKVDNNEASEKIEKTDVQPRVKANHKSKKNVKSTQVQSSLESRVKPRTRTIQVQTSLQSGSSSSLEQHEKLTKSFTPKRKRIGRTAAPQPAPRAAIRTIVATRGATGSNKMKVEDTTKLTPSKRSKRTPKRRIPKSESNSEERLRSPAGRPPAPPEPPAPVHPTTPALSPSAEEEHISPNVTCSRGKDNARREFKKKLAEGQLDLETAVETVSVFARQLETEHTRLQALADSWEPAATDPDVPEEAQELVLAAVGQTRLLLGQKMSQFRSLIARAESPHSSAPLVTRADLQGYWDMMFMQITDVDLRFKKLEGIRARGWQECSSPVPARPAPPPAPAALRRAAPPRAPPRAATSRLKDLIAAARLARRDKNAAAGSPHPLPFAVSSPQWRSPRAAPRSPATPAGAGTPLHNRSLLQVVLSSEAQRSARRSSSSFAMMRASLLARDLQIDGVRPLQRTPESPPTAVAAVTPARSILKCTSAHHAGAHVGTTPAGDGPRARKTVLFTDDDCPGPARDENTRPRSVLRRQPAVQEEDLISLETPPAPPSSVAARLPRRSERLSRQDTPLRSLDNLHVSHLTPSLRRFQLDDSSVTKATPDVTPRRRSTRRKRHV